MKKLYTLALVALSAASAFAAPTLPTLEEALENQKTAGRMPVKHTLESKRIAASDEVLNARKAKKAAKAAAFASANELSGVYFSQDYGQFTTNKSAWETTGMMELVGTADNKVTINNFYFPNYSVNGTYDPATGVITVPAAQAGNYNIEDAQGNVIGTAPIAGGVLDLNTGAINDFEFTVNKETHSFSWESSTSLDPSDGKYYYDYAIIFCSNTNWDIENDLQAAAFLSEGYEVNTVGQFQMPNDAGTALDEPVLFYSYVELTKDEEGKDAISATGYNGGYFFKVYYFPGVVYFTLNETKTTATASYQLVYPGSGYDLYLWGTTINPDYSITWAEEPISEFQILTEGGKTFLYKDFSGMSTFKDAAGKATKVGVYESYLLLPQGLLSNGAGVSNVTVDANGPAEYFNLEGVRVANPENGIFIRRQGGKATKVVM